MSLRDESLALFVLLGQTAEREIANQPLTVPPESLSISSSYDIASILPDEVRQAVRAAQVYKLLFVFENFLRELVLGVLSEDDKENWWNKVPKDVQDAIAEEEKREETKAWMALGSRSKLSLTTYQQILRVVEHHWDQGFEALIRDKSLIQEARHIAHLRNAICHMTEIPPEEVERVKQVIRDWFRVVAP